MKAMALEKFGEPLIFREMPDPTIGPDDVLVRVRACGVCQTDLKLMSGKHPAGARHLPHILGHEIAGEVAAVGGSVRNLQPGDRVALAIYGPCGECEVCREGRETLCVQLKSWAGFRDPGGMAEYVRASAQNAIPLPPGVPFAEAAIVGCSGATAYHAVMTRGRARPGQTALVLGMGGVGLLTAQMACAAGVRVVAADVTPEKLQMVRELGVAETLLMRGNLAEAVAEIRALVPGGPHLVFECSGARAAQQAAAQTIRTGGAIVLVGYSLDGDFVIPSHDLVLREISVVGSRAGGVRECTEVVQWLAEGRFRSVIDRVMPLREANTALHLLRQGEVRGRIVLEVD